MPTPSTFFHFLSNPTYSEVDRKETNIFTTAIKLYLLYILFIGMAYGLIILVLKTLLTLPVDETVGILSRFKDHLWKYVLVVALAGPIIEEIVFRLSLIFNPVYFSLSFATIIGVLSRTITSRFNGLLIFIIIFFLIFQVALAYSSNLESFWKNHFRFIFYTFSILFGLGHVFNYRFIETSQYLIAPLLVLPQLILGFVLSFTRLYYRKGLIIAILIHVLMNTIAVSITLSQHSG